MKFRPLLSVNITILATMGSLNKKKTCAPRPLIVHHIRTWNSQVYVSPSFFRRKNCCCKYPIQLRNISCSSSEICWIYQTYQKVHHLFLLLFYVVISQETCFSLASSILHCFEAYHLAFYQLKQLCLTNFN